LYYNLFFKLNKIVILVNKLKQVKMGNKETSRELE
jgi:hypothetical protein